jgi:hypothetical protein
VLPVGTVEDGEGASVYHAHDAAVEVSARAIVESRLKRKREVADQGIVAQCIDA